MSYSEDGLADIAIGFVFLGWGVLLVDKLPGLFALLGPIAWAIWYLGKRFLTVPRIGIIEPSQKMENRLRNLAISLIVLGVAALAGVLLAVGRGGSFLADYSLGFLGLVFAAGICLVAFLLAANRLYVYAMMLFVAFAGGQALNDVVSTLDTFVLPVITAGALVVFSGLVVLVRFLQKYPIPATEEAG
jgi:hypothetical protein